MDQIVKKVLFYSFFGYVYAVINMVRIEKKLVYHLDELPDVVVMDLLLIGRRVIVPKRFMKMILSAGIWTLNPYWRWNGLLKKEELMMFFECVIRRNKGEECDLPKELIRRIAFYILVYVENLAFEVAIENIALNRKSEALKYLKFMKPLLEYLRNEYKKAVREPSIEIILRMQDKCLEYAIDPF